MDSSSRRIALKLVVMLVMVLASCARRSESPMAENQLESAADSSQQLEHTTDPHGKERRQMVIEQLAGRDIVNQRVLETMGRVPRHEFVPAISRSRAYDDTPLPIGEGQTISQPYIVALMTQLVDPQPHHKALDIGTGSGYQAAVLAELVASVYSIEIVDVLATTARERLRTLGYRGVNVRHGDGYHGWESEAPFDIVIVAAAPDHIPQTLVKQLAPGGKMVIPVGKHYQTLLLLEKDRDGTVMQSKVAPVAFVPMTGAARR